MLSRKLENTHPIATSTLIILLSFILFGAFGCTDEEVDPSIEESEMCLVEIDGVFENIPLDAMPVYLNGGESGFLDQIYMILKYPAQARADGIEGTCIANYEITEEGKVENIVVLEDPGGGIGDAVFAVLSTITAGVAYNPAMLNGKPVRVRKEFLVKFKLEG